MALVSRLALALILSATPAFSHYAISGWAYSTSCCSGRDCHHIPTVAAHATDGGWLVTIDGADHPQVSGVLVELVPYADKRVHQSGDDLFHACIVGVEVGQHIRCLYVPGMLG